MVQIKNLSKIYLSKKKIKTVGLENINLDLKNNGLVFITGTTGCGKSTLLNILGRLDEETSGSILIDNEDITKFNNKKCEIYRNNNIGFVFQEYNLIDEFTVYENIALVYKLKKEKVNKKEIEKLLSQFGLLEKMNKRCDELSGGERQRVTIIRAIIKKPKMILADEPTGALDEETGENIFKILKDISKETLVIVVTHDEEYLEKYGDRIVELEDGKIIKDTLKLELKEKTEKKEITNYKSKLSLKEIFKLSLSTIKKRILRLTLMSLIILSTIIILGTLTTYASYNKNKAIYYSTLKAGNNYIFVKSKKDTADRFPATILNENDKTYFEGKYNQKFYPTYKILQVNFKDNSPYYDTSTSSRNFYSKVSYGSIEINEEIAKNLGLKLYTGRFPTADNEIIISDYHFILFKDFGYCENKSDPNTYIKIEKYNDILGKTIDNGKLTIVGVMNTNFDENRYKILKQYNTGIIDGDLGLVNLHFEMEIILASTLAGHVFFNKGYINRFLEENNLIDRRLYLTEMPSLYYGNSKENSDIIYNIESLGKISSCQEEIIFKNGYSKETLDDDEIVVEYNLLFKKHLNFEVEGEKIYSYIYNIASEIIYSFEGIKMLTEIKEELGYPDNVTEEECKNYLNWKVFTSVLKEVLTDDIFEKLSNVTFYVREMNGEYTIDKKVKIVGVYYKNPLLEISVLDSSLPMCFYISDNFFDEFINLSNSHYYRGFYTSLDKKGLNLVNQLSLEEKYDMYSQHTAQISRAENYLRKTSKLAIKVEIVLIIFSILLFVTYMDFIIKDRKKDIGILLSLGTRKKDIAKIFIFISLIIALVVFIIGLIGSIILTNLLNNEIKHLYCAIIDILTFDIYSVIVMSLISISLIIITKLIIDNLTKKNPIDIMKSQRD